jgi:hypothetical protein
MLVFEPPLDTPRTLQHRGIVFTQLMSHLTGRLYLITNTERSGSCYSDGPGVADEWIVGCSFAN